MVMGVVFLRLLCISLCIYIEDGRLRAILVGHVNRISEFKFDITYQDGIDTLWSSK